MKARISRCYDRNAPEEEQMCWGILIQQGKGKPFNIMAVEKGRIYSTLHKQEAIEKVKKLNKLFEELNNENKV